jgi:hypothetical protein
MEGVVPSPACTSLIIVRVDPLEAFKVTLSNVLDKFSDVLFIYMKLFPVVPHLPTLLS